MKVCLTLEAIELRRHLGARHAELISALGNLIASLFNFQLSLLVAALLCSPAVQLLVEEALTPPPLQTSVTLLT